MYQKLEFYGTLLQDEKDEVVKENNKTKKKVETTNPRNVTILCAKNGSDSAQLK